MKGSSVKLISISSSAILTAGIVMAQAPWPQDTKNPGLTIETVPLPTMHMTMGLTFLADGRMVWATAGVEGGGEIPSANANSAVWIVSGLTGNMSGVAVKKVSDMMRQPAGVVVESGKVYASDRDAFYQIPNLDNPANTATNRTKVIGWPTPDAGFTWTQGEQWHQWAATPVYYNGKFYAPYGGSIQVGGRSATPPTSSYSGAFVSWNPDGSGGFTKIAGGFRVPNGMTMTPTGQFFVTDNQGSWVPACRFDMIKPNKFYGHRQTPPNKANWAEGLPYEPPVMWLVDGVHQSASQPLYMEKGPYAGDFLVGDDNSPGLSRIALDNVNGSFNGSMFFFTGGFSNNAINRLAMHSKEDAILVGTFLAMGDWPGGSVKPVYRVTFGNVASVMEMRSIHSRQGGIEIVYSQAVDPATAVPSSFTLSQWHVSRTDVYGCCIDEKTTPTVTEVKISKDNKRLFLALTGSGAATDRVIRVNGPGVKSSTGGSQFHSTAYFSHNHQSAAAFNPDATTSLADRDPAAEFMELAVSHSVQPGILTVKSDLTGSYSVSVHSLSGAELARQTGNGKGTFTFRLADAPGMKVLRVSKSGRTLARPVLVGNP